MSFKNEDQLDEIKAVNVSPRVSIESGRPQENSPISSTALPEIDSVVRDWLAHLDKKPVLKIAKPDDLFLTTMQLNVVYAIELRERDIVKRRRGMSYSPSGLSGDSHNDPKSERSD